MKKRILLLTAVVAAGHLACAQPGDKEAPKGFDQVRRGIAMPDFIGVGYSPEGTPCS
jgi:hypothetical protein